MNAMKMLKTTAAICVSIVQEVTIVSVQMDSKCHKATRLVNVQKVSRSPITVQFAWVSNNTNAVAGKKEEKSQRFQMSQDNKTCKCPKGSQESNNRTMCLGK